MTPPSRQQSIVLQALRMGERSDLGVAKRCARAPKAAGNNRHQIARPQSPLFDARSEGDEIIDAKGMFKLRQSTQRETQSKGARPKGRLDFTAMKIGHQRLTEP